MEGGRRGKEKTFTHKPEQGSSTSVCSVVATIIPFSVPASRLVVYIKTLLSGSADSRESTSGVDGYGYTYMEWRPQTEWRGKMELGTVITRYLH